MANTATPYYTGFPLHLDEPSPFVETTNLTLLGWSLPETMINTGQITSSSNQSIDVCYDIVARRDGITYPFGTVNEIIVRLWTTFCPVSGDCDEATHHLLLHVTEWEGSYYVRDLNLMVLHDFDRDTVPLMAIPGPNLDLNVLTAAQNVMGSMQWRGRAHTPTDAYGAVVYNGPITLRDNRMVVPRSRRLITTGDSISYQSPNAQTITFAPAETITVTTDTTIDTTSDTTVDMAAHYDAAEIDRLRQQIRSMEDTIDSAKDVAGRYTVNNSGCEDGKRQFLRDLGLHDADEIDELFGRDIEVTVTIPVVVTQTIEATITVRATSEDDAIEMVNDDPESYVMNEYNLGDLTDMIDPDRYNTEFDYNEAEATV